MAAMTALAIGSLALSAVAGGVSAYSSYQQGQTADAVGRYNARLTENAATQADLEAREEIRRMRVRNRELLAQRRAQVGASGIVGFAGSPLAVLGDMAGRLELDALEQARQSESNMRRARDEASMQRKEGSLARKGAVLGAAGTLLSTAGKTAGGYVSYFG